MSHFDPLTHNTLNDPTTEDIQESMQKLENVQSSVYSQEDGMVSYKDFNPTLTFEEASAGGMGRHLGVFSCTMLIVGTIIGTGIFSAPASILGSVRSVGASLLLWVLGFIISFCGLFIWLEFGTMIPRSGGEKVYLEAVYKKPKYLASVIFAVNAIILGFSAAPCISSDTLSILIVAGHTADRWVVRGIAIAVIVFVTCLHGLAPRLGVWSMNVLSVFKTVILFFIVIAGWVVLSGKTPVHDPYANFRNSFSGSSRSGNDYATATLKVLYTYSGWSSVNYVLNDVRDPVRTLKISGPLGLAICAALYILANVAYFAAATKEEIQSSGVTISALFFQKVFGEQARRALSIFVALSPYKAHLILFKSFAASRVNQELAKEGVPLPGGNHFWASNWPTGESPFPGLVIRMIPSMIVIIAPPPKVAYPFMLNLEEYPQQIINFFIVIGLFWLRYKKPNAMRPFKGRLFLLRPLLLIIAPFLQPANKVGDTPPLPYYLYCLVGFGVMFFGVFYWVVWWIVLPKLGKYQLVSKKETLKDGTVITIVRLICTKSVHVQWPANFFVLAVHAQKDRLGTQCTHQMSIKCVIC
ncbi:amino acid transporter [Tricholoma matsutake]|nr:amino acid transporter [Tricholoma matsutake 945]